MVNLLSKFNKSALGLLILGVGIGLLLTVQWKTPVTRVSNSITPYVSLRDTRDDLLKEQDELKERIKNLQKEITNNENELKKYSNNQNDIKEIEDYKKRIGLTELKGEGVIIKLDDSIENEINSDSIIHAADLRDIVNFLWSIGAEAISINGERIVYSTSIDCIVNTILINSTKTVPPFNIKVIGKSNNIYEQLNSVNNLKDIKKRVKNKGLIFEFRKEKNINIPIYDGSFVIENITIVE
ncbi:MAG: DUF881 domain-containing protein [Candidatus Helarchaeota archaeon]